VPVIDAAIRKIVRLTGGFHLRAESEEGQALLDRFAARVPVNAGGVSLQLFADQMLDSLLTYGNAVGEWMEYVGCLEKPFSLSGPNAFLVERVGNDEVGAIGKVDAVVLWRNGPTGHLCMGLQCQ